MLRSDTKHRRPDELLHGTNRPPSNPKPTLKERQRNPNGFLTLTPPPHLERYYPSNLGFAHLENVDEMHLNLRSNWNRAGARTDDLAAGDAVVDHSIDANVPANLVFSPVALPDDHQ